MMVWTFIGGFQQTGTQKEQGEWEEGDVRLKRISGGIGRWYKQW